MAKLNDRIRDVLQETVGFFVELPEEALKVAVLSGTATLGPNLKIRQDFFERLGLPVVLTAGQIDRIDVAIPTTHLRTKPLVVTIKQILITLNPNPDVNMRRARLQQHERHWSRAGEVDEEEIDLGSATGKIIQKLVDNVKVIIKDVHIRLEDTHTSRARQSSQLYAEHDGAQRCYSLGVVIDSVKLRSFVVSGEGSAWQETCVKQVQRFLNKSLTFGLQGAPAQHLSGLGVYVHPGEQPMKNPGSDAWREEMLTFIPSRRTSTKPIHWVVGPTVAELRASVDKHPDVEGRFSRMWTGIEGAEREIKLRIGLLPLVLQQTVLRNLYGLYYFYQNVSRWQLLSHIRPRCPVHGNGRKWWQFAIQCEIQEINRRYISIKGLRTVIRDGRDYVALWTRKAGTGRPWLLPLSAEELARLQAFEDHYPVDVTMTFRVRGWRDLLAGDKQRQGHVEEEREMSAALLAMPAARIRRAITDLPDPNYEVDFVGSIATESGGSARKKAKDAWVAIVTFKSRTLPPLHSGWLELRTTLTTQKREPKLNRVHMWLTADEMYHSPQLQGGKKTRVRIAACQPAVLGSAGEFELRSKDRILNFKCRDVGAAQEWVRSINLAVKTRANLESVVFDPTKHLAKANQPVDLKFTMHVQMEAASPTKGSFRKKKVMMEDVMLHLTINGFSICNTTPLSEEAATELPADQILRIEDSGQELPYQITTTFPFKRLRTWSLEQNSTCCRVDVSQSGQTQSSFRFFSSDTNQASDVLEAIQLCIAELMATQKRLKARRAEIRSNIVDIFSAHAPARCDEVDSLLKAHPGKKAEELLAQLQEQYVPVTASAQIEPGSEAAVESHEDILVTFQEGPLGVSFGSESEDSIGWIETIKPDSQASSLGTLAAGMELVAVQQTTVRSYQEAVAAIQAAGRPLDLTFRCSHRMLQHSVPSEPLTAVDPQQMSSETESQALSIVVPGGVDATTSESRQNVIWVGHIESQSATEAKILTALSPLGKIVGVTIRRKEHDKSWALIVFDNLVSAEKALVATERTAAGCTVEWTIAPYQPELIDSKQALQKDFAAMAKAAEHQASEALHRERWLVRYSGPDDDEAAEAIHLISHTIEPPSKQRKEYAFDATLTAKHVNGSIHTLSLATADADAAQKLNELLTATSTQVNLASTPRVMPAQEDLLNSVDDLGSFRLSESYDDREDDDDTDPDIRASRQLGSADADLRASVSVAATEIVKEAGVALFTEELLSEYAGNNASIFDVMNHVSIDLEHVTVDLTMPTFDILRAEFLGLHGDTLNCQHGVECTSLRVTDLILLDRYSRNSVFAKLVSRSSAAFDFESSPRRGHASADPFASSRRTPSPVDMEASEDTFPDQDQSKSPPKLTSEAAVGRRRASVDESAAEAGDPFLYFEHERTPRSSMQLSRTQYTKSTRVVLQPVRVILNTALLPVFRDFIRLQDFKVQRRSMRGNSDGVLSRVRSHYEVEPDSTALAAPKFERHYVDIILHAPEVVLPEACTIVDDDTVMLACAADEISVKTDEGNDNPGNVDGETATVTNLTAYTCGRSRWIAEHSAASPMKQKTYRTQRRGAESSHAIVANLAAAAALKGSETQILLPLSATIRIQRPVLAHDPSQRGLVINCHSEAVRARISGEALKELLVIAVHASELIYMHQNSVTKFLKRVLRDDLPQPKARSQEDSDTPSGTEPNGWFRQKILKLQRLTEELAGTAKETALQKQCSGVVEGEDVAISSSEPSADAAAPESVHDASSATIPWLFAATVSMQSLEVIITGEPRGGSVDALTLGVRSHGASYGMLIGCEEHRTQWSLEGIEILSSDKDRNGAQSPRDNESVNASYSAWPRATVSAVRNAAGDLSYEAYSTASPERVVNLSKPGDMLNVLEGSEIAKLLPLARTVIGESDRLLSMLAPIAAKVGLGDKLPRFPASYAAAIQELVALTSVAGTESDSDGHIEHVRAKLRTLVDQQVAKYSPVAEQLLGRVGGGNEAITSLAGQVLKGDMDIGAVKSELQGNVMHAAQDRLAVLETELTAQLTAGAEQLHARTAAAASKVEGGRAEEQTLSGAAWSELVSSVVGGARDITAIVATDPTGLDAAKLKEALANRTSQLESVVRDEVERRFDHRVAGLPLDQLESQAVEALQRENARLSAEVAKLLDENARLQEQPAPQ